MIAAGVTGVDFIVAKGGKYEPYTDGRAARK